MGNYDPYSDNTRILRVLSGSEPIRREWAECRRSAPIPLVRAQTCSEPAAK